MAYTLDIGLALGTSKAGLTDLRAQLVDTAGSNVGAAVSTGFWDAGQGNYLWHYASFPDDHRGGAKFYSNADSGTTLAFVAINPEEAENTDIQLSSGAVVAASVTGAVGSVTGNVGGNVVGSVASVTGAVGSVGSGGITAASIATGAIDADAIAADAVTEIQAGLSTLDAAGVRAAVGLAAANLDTQLTTIDDFLDTEVAAIKAKTDNLPASPAAVGSAMTLASGAITAAVVATGAIDADAIATDAAQEIADAILDRTDGVETSLTLRQALRLVVAAASAKLSGAATTTIVIRNYGDTKDRITATVDANGNRTAITYDLT